MRTFAFFLMAIIVALLTVINQHAAPGVLAGFIPPMFLLGGFVVWIMMEGPYK